MLPDASHAEDVELSRFGSYVALYDATEGNSVRLFDSDLRELWRRRLSHYWAGSLDAGSVLQFSPDDSFIIFPGERNDNDICICDTETGEPIDVLRHHKGAVRAIALSPDGEWLASAGGRDELFLWVRRGESFVRAAGAREFERSVHSLEFLPDGGGFVISYRRDQNILGVSLFKITKEGFEERSTWEFQDNNISYQIHQIAVSPDGETLAAGYSDSLIFFSLSDGKLREEQRIEEIDLGITYSLAFSADGSTVVSGHNGYVRWWQRDESTWVEAATGETQRPVTHDLELSPAGDLYVASRADENALSRFTVRGVGASPLGTFVELLGGSLSLAQRRALTDLFVRETLGELGEAALAPRDMFETREEHEARLEHARRYIAVRLADALEERYEGEQLSNPDATYDLLLPVQAQGSYDIDNRLYTLRFMDTEGSVILERNGARELYTNWQQARIRVTRFEQKGTPGYADFRLTHPSLLAEYPIMLGRNPFTGEELNVAGSYVPAVSVGPEIRLEELELSGIFPTLHARYAEEPFGRFTVKNKGTGIVSDLEVTFTVEGLTGSPRSVELPSSLAAGHSVEAFLTAPISESILTKSEGGTATLTITVAYRRGDSRRSGSVSRQIRLLNRNAIQWDDDRKIGAFMTVYDPALLAFGGRVAGAGTVLPTTVLTRNLLYAVGIFEAVRAVGIEYVVDPNSAYEEFSRNSGAVDYLRFPRETLAGGAGDCDDLSALYATLLESVGVPTALITTPGHIFAAFDTGLRPSQVDQLFYAPENLVLLGETAWMPVETTLFSEGFTRAWQVGALQWRQADPRGEAVLFSSREAWRAYPPVTPPTTALLPEVDLQSVNAAVAAELDRFRAVELEPRLNRFTDKGRDDLSAEEQVEIGVLYARYALLDEAAGRFEAALELNESIPALVNIANVLSLSGRHEEARGYLKRAQELEPENGRVLLGLAFSHWESGEQEAARTSYEMARSVDPYLAQQYPLFASSDARGGTRSSGASESASALFGGDWLE
ncbi:MAG: hypothetical protein ACLFPP_03980 [Spirochaetaceae bacterium]